MEELEGARVLVTGGTGFLGRHVCEALQAEGALAFPVSRKKHYDLRNEAEALSAVLAIHPDIVVHLAATVGGIGANMAAPATFFRENMLMGMNVVHATAVARAKLVCVGTVCSYPKNCPIPFVENNFWDGYPEETNAPYGVSKKALFVMCQAYRKQHRLHYGFLVPANLYGPGDSVDLDKSHVIPAMIRKFVEAKLRKESEVTCWGTGKPTRSFLHVSDAARAITLACAKLDHDDIVNLPGGQETPMSELAGMIASIVGYRGKIVWDPSKPDGQPRRAIDGTRAKELLHWSPEIPLEKGLAETIEWYIASGGK